MPGVVAVFNECSLPSSPLDDRDAASIIGTFSGMMLSLRAIRSDVALDSPVALADQEIATGGRTFSVFAFANGGRIRDQWRLVQRMLARAPFFRDPPSTTPHSSLEVYRWKGVPAVGLGRAARHEQVAVSLFTAPGWDDRVIEVEREWLEETSAGPADLTANVTVLHASRSVHIEFASDHIREMSLPFGFSGMDLWIQRDVLFPGIGFLPRVEDDLAALASGAPALRQVRLRLRQLAHAARDWHRDGGAAPEWLSPVTPEGVQRQRLCMFRDLDGESRCFDLHARFTPRHGRIHMRLNQAVVPPYVTIAYIGQKLK